MKTLPAVPPELARSRMFQGWHEKARAVHAENEAKLSAELALAKDGVLCAKLKAEVSELKLQVVGLEREVVARGKLLKDQAERYEAKLVEHDTVLLADEEREGLKDRISGLEDQLAALKVELKARTSERDGAWRRLEKLKGEGRDAGAVPAK